MTQVIKRAATDLISSGLRLGAFSGFPARAVFPLKRNVDKFAVLKKELRGQTTRSRSSDNNLNMSQVDH